jgi:hypothetical protein
MTSPRPLLILLAALLALDAFGFGVALATGIVDPLPGFLNGSKTHAPLVIWGAQALGVWLLLARRRPRRDPVRDRRADRRAVGAARAAATARPASSAR